MSFYKFEYRSEIFEGNRQSVMTWLNNQGKLGWELCQCSTTVDRGLTYFHCMFKRQLVEAQVQPEQENYKVAADKLRTMLITLCHNLEKDLPTRKKHHPAIDSVPELRRWYQTHKPGRKADTKPRAKAAPKSRPNRRKHVIALANRARELENATA